MIPLSTPVQHGTENKRHKSSIRKGVGSALYGVVWLEFLVPTSQIEIFKWIIHTLNTVSVQSCVSPI